MSEDADTGREAALASKVRREVLELLLGSDHPLNASEIAAKVGLHVTTARFHLEHLENAKLIRRQIDREGRRGRPPITYVADPRAREQDTTRQLALVLTDALSRDADGGRARGILAGEHWGDSYVSALAGAHDGDTSQQLVRVLDLLGFEPEARTPESDEDIRLLSCPFRDIAVDHREVVCSIHLGLLYGAMAGFGRDAADVSLNPFVEPDVCVVQLHQQAG
ncbi:MAG: helix-turn-helix domain-containing protein [Microbacteriaceae bacterium]